MAIGLAGDPVGQAGDAAGMFGRLSPGKARHREIEAAPEEMHRARLAEEAGAKAFEDRHDPLQSGVQSFG